MTEQPPLSVWLTAQCTARGQRGGRYVPASTAHPGKMLPAIAAQAITDYTQPGDLVLDPMCGIGTTLVEQPISAGTRSASSTRRPGRSWRAATCTTREVRAPPVPAQSSTATPASSTPCSTQT